MVPTEGNAWKPLCLNVTMHILHSFLYTLPLVLNGEFVKQSSVSLICDHFLYCHDFMFDTEVILSREIRHQSLLGKAGTHSNHCKAELGQPA